MYVEHWTWGEDILLTNQSRKCSEIFSCLPDEYKMKDAVSYPHKFRLFLPQIIHIRLDRPH